MAQVALIKGILYDQEACRSAWELVAGLSWEQFQALHHDVTREGVRALAAGTPVVELAGTLVGLAREGLLRQAGPDGGDEVRFLAPLEIILRDGESPARRLLRLWQGPMKGDRRRLIQHLARVNLDCYRC